MAPGGNPIGYEIYEGNIHEGKTQIPVIEALAKKHGFGHPIVVADAGLLSKANIDELQKNCYEYIIGARVKNEADVVKQAIIDMNLQYGDIKVIDKDEGIRLIVSKSEKKTELCEMEQRTTRIDTEITLSSYRKKLCRRVHVSLIDIVYKVFFCFVCSGKCRFSAMEIQ